MMLIQLLRHHLTKENDHVHRETCPQRRLRPRGGCHRVCARLHHRVPAGAQRAGAL